jgi:formamidopyrimidine-DNA glycosylase
MPELPNVEATKDMMNEKALGHTVTNVIFKTPQVLADITPTQLEKKLKNHQFKRATRHGKYLILETNSKEFLILHFGLRGGLKYQNQHKTEKSGMIRLDLDNDYCLIYTGLYGKVGLVENVEAFLKKLNIGPDALKITLLEFQESIKKAKGNIKSFLMDQHILSGLGNLYVDEILFQSRIHPKALVSDLSAKQIKTIYTQMQKVLKMAVGLKGQWSKFSKSYFIPHREGDGLCPNCGEALSSAKVAGRTTYFCKRDQIM